MAYEIYNTATPFIAVIGQDGTIYSHESGRAQFKVGVDSKKEEEHLAHIRELTAIADEYRDKLIELGAIKEPKTPEDALIEQMNSQKEVNETLMAEIRQMRKEIAAIVGGLNADRGTDEHGAGERPRNRKNDGQGRKGSAASDRAGQEDTAADS
jgi:hypothetical protein